MQQVVIALTFRLDQHLHFALVQLIPFAGAVLSKRLGACAHLHLSQLHLV
jgi:hypothetical protein